MKKITYDRIKKFESYLTEAEKARITVEKYVRDIRAFYSWLDGRRLDKSRVLDYKAYLCDGYAIRSVNSMLSSLNCFFKWAGWHELNVKTVRLQRNIFSSVENELTKEEYERPLSAAIAKNRIRLYLLIQTVCSTGIRISELKYITVKSARDGVTEINNKGKVRRVFLPTKLCKILKEYVKKQRLCEGPVFVSKDENPLDRSNIWGEMKRLCRVAGVSESKVYPHNLRHLFARTYYSKQKDVVRLADILGHSSINTTRIYTAETGETHRRQIQQLGLVN